MLVSQKGLNAESYFQAAVQSELGKLNGMMWVDDSLTRGTHFDDLLHTVGSVMERSENGKLYAIAHKRILYDTRIKWCRKVYASAVVKHDNEGVPQDEVSAGRTVEDLSHEPVGFPSATFHESPFRWGTVSNKGLQS